MFKPVKIQESKREKLWKRLREIMQVYDSGESQVSNTVQNDKNIREPLSFIKHFILVN